MPSALPPCSPDVSVTELELRQAYLDGLVESLTIRRHLNQKYFVLVRMERPGSNRRRWYLATRRKREVPRMFTDLGALTRLLSEVAPVTCCIDPGETALPGIDAHHEGQV